MKYLGETIDIHGGGIDLCFPHHENEIAQTECVTGKTFVKHWFHSEHLQVEGQKMSKSLGNLFTLADLKNKGYDAPIVRYALIAGHYRQILNFTLSGLDAARSTLGNLKIKVANLCEENNFRPSEDFFLKNISYHHFNGAIEALKNDLNIPKCLGEIFSVLNGTQNTESLLEELYALCFILGIEKFIFHRESDSETVEIPNDIAELAMQRWEAKCNKNFSESDRLRQLLGEKGWNVVDHKDGYELEKINA
jgi:cysteinyl-tRNA synthetase